MRAQVLGPEGLRARPLVGLTATTHWKAFLTALAVVLLAHGGPVQQACAAAGFHQQTSADPQFGSIAGMPDLKDDLQAFRASRVPLGEALVAAQGLHPDGRVMDISFDQDKGVPAYLVKSVEGDRIWEDAIDANTGGRLGQTIGTPVSMLGKEDRRNLAALKHVHQEIIDAVLVAERSAAGKAISGGLLNDNGRLSFSIVVISGDDIKQVVLEPPSAREAGTRRRTRR